MALGLCIGRHVVYGAVPPTPASLYLGFAWLLNLSWGLPYMTVDPNSSLVMAFFFTIFASSRHPYPVLLAYTGVTSLPSLLTSRFQSTIDTLPFALFSLSSI